MLRCSKADFEEVGFSCGNLNVCMYVYVCMYVCRQKHGSLLSYRSKIATK